MGARALPSAPGRQLGYTDDVQEYPSLVWHLKNTKLFEDLSAVELEELSRITP